MLNILQVLFIFSAISTSTSRETTPESEEEDEDLADEDDEEEDDFAEEESFAAPGFSPNEDNPKSPKFPLISRAVSRNEEELRESYDRCFKEFYPNQVIYKYYFLR